MNADPVWLLLAAYGFGVVAFVLVGCLEWAMSAVELRRIDRDEWSRGEPWQIAHQHRARDRERISINHAATLITWSSVWPLLVLSLILRIAGRRRKERTTHE